MSDLSGTRDVKEGGRCLRTIMLVDVSQGTGKNNRSAKLGSGNQTFASAVIAFDGRTRGVVTGDGTGSQLTRYPFEPDNWIFRRHGHGFDNVWAVRLTVDKDNKAQDKKNRSTHVIDQANHQKYGTFSDLFWICKTDVDTDYDVDGGGFIGGGSGTRDALALSMAKNEGFISDGKKFGQLAHVLCFLDPEPEPSPGKPPKPTTPTGGLRPIATPDNTNGFSANQVIDGGGGINPPAGPGGAVSAPLGPSGEVQAPVPPPPEPEIPANDPIRTGNFR